MSHSLYLGDLDLIGEDFDSFKIETIAEGMDFGTASPVDVVVQSLLQDGSPGRTERWDNRSITFGVLISGSDLISVAAGEAALYAELARRNTLTWTPPDGWGPPTVFDVVTSWADFEFDDWGEMEPNTIGRRFVIRLNCLPWGRDVLATTVDAVTSGGAPPTPSTVTIDSGDSITGWSRSAAPSGWAASGPQVISLSGGGNAVSAGASSAVPVGGPPFVVGIKRSSLTSDMTSTKWLVVTSDFSATGYSGPSLTYMVNGVAATPAARLGNRAYFDCSTVPVVTSVEVRVSLASFGGGGGIAVWVDQIERTNVAPFVGTGRQQFRGLNVGGSARTQGSLQIAHDTSSLGDVLVYTNADDGTGYQPACRQYRAAGGTVAPDASTASGAYSPLDGATPETYDIPARSLPAGTYTILARVKMRTGSATALLTATAATRNGGIDSTSRSVGRFSALTTAWTIVEIGRLTLPPTAVPAGSSSVVRLKLSTATAVDVDECWVFNVDIGALTWVRAGTGSPVTFGASNRLWLDTATLDRPRPSVWLGTQADRSDARHALGFPEVESSGTHIFPPGPVNLFTVTTNALNAAASLDYYRSWANNAGAA